MISTHAPRARRRVAFSPRAPPPHPTYTTPTPTPPTTRAAASPTAREAYQAGREATAMGPWAAQV